MPRADTHFAAKPLRLLIILWASVSTDLASAQASVLAAEAAMPAPGAFVDQAKSGAIDAESFDFDKAGFFELATPDRQQWIGGFFAALGNPFAAEAPPCLPETQRSGVALTWAQLAGQSVDAIAWRQSAQTLRARLAQFDALLAQAPPVYSGSDPRVKELLARFAADQAVRSVFSEKKWTDGLSGTETNSWMLAAASRVTRIDCDNTAWLKNQLAAVGWFTISKYGEPAETAAWHLVQHADREPAFQNEMLAKLRALPPGETNGRRLGMLTDRVAIAQGRLQVYGTQGQCHEGQWTPFESEDPANLDQRRASLGMTPIAEHMKLVSREACPH